MEVHDPGLVGSADWRALRDGARPDHAGAPPNYSSYLAEEHHHFYGRPWCIGRTYFEYLKTQGLRPCDRVLDFGCGAGRIGIWLIPFLETGHYTGVDHQWTALDAFARYEIPLHDLARCEPRLVLDGSLDIARLADRFDVILDCFVSFHLDEADRLRLYRGFAASLSATGRIFLPHPPTLDADSLASLGLSLLHQEVKRSPFLEGHHPKDHDHWHVIGASAMRR